MSDASEYIATLAAMRCYGVYVHRDGSQHRYLASSAVPCCVCVSYASKSSLRQSISPLAMETYQSLREKRLVCDPAALFTVPFAPVAMFATGTRRIQASPAFLADWCQTCDAYETDPCYAAAVATARYAYVRYAVLKSIRENTLEELHRTLLCRLPIHQLLALCRSGTGNQQLYYEKVRNSSCNFQTYFV